MQPTSVQRFICIDLQRRIAHTLSRPASPRPKSREFPFHPINRPIPTRPQSANPFAASKPEAER